MSTIPLRVAEVEARLHLVRRRINAFTLQHVAYLGLTVLALVAAALIVVGLRASAEAFRLAAWGSVAIALATAAFCASILAMRWVDLRRAATLADRRGGLSDRLTTLMSLRVRRQDSQLAPLLVTQILDLRARWRPELVTPRGVPRTLFALLAALALLASTAFLERSSGEAFAAKNESSRQAQPRFEPGGDVPQPQPRSQQPDGMPGDGDDGQALQAGYGDVMSGGGGADAGGAHDGTTGLDAGTEIGELPDRLQEAIQRAFRAEPMKKMRQVGGLPDMPAAGRGGEAEQRDQRGEMENRDALASKGKRESRGESDRPPAPMPGAGSNRKPDGKRGDEERRGRGNAEGQGTGSAAAGVDGADTRPALGDVADLPATSGVPTTFKLTLSSFLAAVDSRGVKQWSGKTTAAPNARGDEAGPGLNDRQLADDVLRKPEIPPEYEDVVRRAYSAGK